MAALPLTRADVRDEIQAELERFAGNVLKREMEQLAVQVRQGIRETLVEASPLHKPLSLAAAPPQRPNEPRPLLLRKDLRVILAEVLNEWWAGLSPSDDGAGPSSDDRKTLAVSTKQPEPKAGGSDGRGDTLARQNAAENGSVTSTTLAGATTNTSLAGSPPVSPGLSPCSSRMSPALLDLVPVPLPSPLLAPMGSPISGPESVPGDSFDVPDLTLPPSRAARKDWRRSFVDRATKTNRKVEYLHASHGRDAHEVNDVVEEAIKALEDGVKPHLVEDGMGGTYFIRGRNGKPIAVFKPRDEEPLAPNNPKIHAGQGQGAGLKEGILVGEAAINEYAAFVLDHSCPRALRAGICPTVLVRVANSVFHSATEDRRSAFRTIKDKVGSFQLFAHHACTSEDVGPSRFLDDQVHRIAALDIRLCNTDRHLGNILVQEEGSEVTALVPIDHGYTLPGEIGDVTFDWLTWPAAHRPFSEEMCREISSIDIDAVEAMLRKRVPMLRSECLSTLRTCTTLLQRGVEAGLTPFDIGTFMTRPTASSAGTQEPSPLEKIVAEAGRQSVSDCGVTQQTLDRLLKEACEDVAQKSASRMGASSSQTPGGAPAAPSPASAS